MQMPEYTVVSDFRANGSTRGAIYPVLDMAGGVLRSRKPGDPAMDIPESLSPADQRFFTAERQKLWKRRAATKAVWSRKHDLLMSYDRDDTTSQFEYLVGVYTWEVGELVSTLCWHHHQSIHAAIWCKDFPAMEPPEHVVIVNAKSGRVKRSVLPVQLRA